MQINQWVPSLFFYIQSYLERDVRSIGEISKIADSERFLAYRLVPHYAILGKRLIKSPKVYLRDTGLASSLIGIEHAGEVAQSRHKGALFEIAVIEEIAKSFLNRGRRPKLSYWRDSAGREIDILVEKGMEVQWAIEVKSSATYSPSFFKHLDALGPELGLDPKHRMVVYTGDESFETSHGSVRSFADFASMPELHQ